jgi:hypothetical protein
LILKTLKRKEYMPRTTAPQTKTAICCLRASAILGTLRARLMVAKERMPSVNIGQYAGVVAVK